MESAVSVSIPYSPSRRRQWLGIAVAALLFAPVFWKPKPLVPVSAPRPATSESAASFEEVIRSASTSLVIATASSSDEASTPSARDPE
jgi:hypothetical protein